MTIDELTTTDSLLFFVISFVVLLIVVIVFIIVIKAIINFIKNLFKKPNKSDNGEDIGVVVRELEESKEERQKIAGLGPTIIPVAKQKSKEEKTHPVMRQGAPSNDGAKGLAKLKGEPTDEDIVVKGVQVPRAKKPEQEQAIKQSAPVVGAVTISVAKLKGEPTAQESVVKGVQVPRAKKPEPQGVQNETTGEVFPSATTRGQLPSETPSNDGETRELSPRSNVPRAKAPQEKIKTSTNDTSIFGGKQEISRINLRQKLRSSKTYQAQKEAGLNLSPIERAKLEKQVFSQSLGQNISKTDLKWGIKKLSGKMMSAKNSVEKGKIRKQIKFFKKIGGIK